MRKLQKKRLKPSEADLRFKERNHLSNNNNNNNNKMQKEEACADIEATARYLGDLAKIINEGGYTKTKYFQCR